MHGLENKRYIKIKTKITYITDVDWSNEFSSNQDMSIPGFNYEFLGAFKTTVHAKTIIQPNGNQLRLKVRYLHRFFIKKIHLKDLQIKLK